MLNRILNSQTKTITFAAVLLSASALLSRVFGLLRQGLLAGYFGRGIEADIYFAAFRIPDFVYNILIAGGVVVAFLPLFSEYYCKKRESAWRFTNYTLNVFLALIILLSLILFIFTPWLLKVIIPGFSPSARAAAADLTRLMFLSPIFFALSSVFSGVLHYFNRFLVYSLAPIFYNLGIIFGIIFLSPSFGIFGVGMGVVLGAFLHFLIQFAGASKCGYKYRFFFSLKARGVKRIFRLMLPRIFAVASQQLNLIVITALASTIATGSVAVFTYANDLFYFPIGVLALPFALASFPALAQYVAQGKNREFQQSFLAVFRKILFLIIPAAVLTFILRAQMVRLILGSLGPGQFDWLATQLTAACLGVFCLGMVGHALLPLLSRAFFSLQDTKTPTLLTAAAVVLNVILSFYFVWLLGFENNIFYQFLVRVLKISGIKDIAVVGLALAFSLSSIFQLILFLFFLRKKIDSFTFKEIWPSLQKTILASFFAGLFAYFTLYTLNNFVDTHKVTGLLAQTAGSLSCGVLIFTVSTVLLKAPELKSIKKSISERFRRN